MIIYSRSCFMIYHSNDMDNYIVRNHNKKFKNGHSHINNYHLAKKIIDMAIKREIPNPKSKYIIQSLIRLSDDTAYIEKLLYILNNKKES